MRQVVGGRAVDANAASASQMGRFETQVLATADNRATLADLFGHWIDRVQGADLPEEMAEWSLTSLQTRPIKIGARLVRHARAITFQLAEVAVSGALFSRILAAIQRPRAPPVSI